MAAALWIYGSGFWSVVKPDKILSGTCVTFSYLHLLHLSATSAISDWLEICEMCTRKSIQQSLACPHIFPQSQEIALLPLLWHLFPQVGVRCPDMTLWRDYVECWPARHSGVVSTVDTILTSPDSRSPWCSIVTVLCFMPVYRDQPLGSMHWMDFVQNIPIWITF